MKWLIENLLNLPNFWNTKIHRIFVSCDARIDIVEEWKNKVAQNETNKKHVGGFLFPKIW